MADKRVRWDNPPLSGTDQVLYVEVEPGVYAQAVAAVSVGQTGGSGSETVQTLLTDEITGALTTIPVVHHEVHEGETFQASTYNDSIADDATMMLLLRTGSARWPHMTFGVAAGGDAEVELLENPQVNNVGTGLTVYNMKRSTTTAPTTQVSQAPAIAGGTLLAHFLNPGGTGANFSAGGTARADSEWILARSSNYVIRITNRSGAAAPVSILVQWYEEGSN